MKESTSAKRWLVAAACFTLLWLSSSPDAQAFSVFRGGSGGPAASLQLTDRWNAEPDPFGGGTGLHDGIQVSVDPDFASDLDTARVAGLYGVSEASVNVMLVDAVVAAFEAWETDALQFDIRFDANTVEGPGGFEMDLFALDDPSETFFAYASVFSSFAADRLLTNGQRFDGYVITGADLVMNPSRLWEGLDLLISLGATLELVAESIERVISHELGHALGLDHPNEGIFYDTDTDPFNDMPIDALDPFVDLIVSSIPLSGLSGDDTPLMWGGVSGLTTLELLALLPGILDPTLRPDELGGRDALYPVPEPGSLGLLVCGLFGVGLFARLQLRPGISL